MSIHRSSFVVVCCTLAQSSRAWPRHRGRNEHAVLSLHSLPVLTATCCSPLPFPPSRPLLLAPLRSTEVNLTPIHMVLPCPPFQAAAAATTEVKLCIPSEVSSAYVTACTQAMSAANTGSVRFTCIPGGSPDGCSLLIKNGAAHLTKLGGEEGWGCV